eukprot:SAG31_NODE_2873_length_4972_cov_3.088241_6_plen_342_part_00
MPRRAAAADSVPAAAAPSDEMERRRPHMHDRIAAGCEFAQDSLRARGLLSPAVLTFDTAAHAVLREGVAEQLRLPAAELGQLHVLEDCAPKKNSTRTKGKRKNEAALARLRAAASKLVCEVVAPHLAMEWNKVTQTSEIADSGELTGLAFQAMPALRVVPPSCERVGQPHRDRDYGHQPGQLNFWIPLSPARGTNTLWVEPWMDNGDQTAKVSRPLQGDWGVLHRFYGNGCRHYTQPNTTATTRVSLDLRVVPGPLFDNDWIGSRHRETGSQAFFVGGYYSYCKFDPSSATWREVQSLPPGTAAAPDATTSFSCSAILDRPLSGLVVLTAPRLLHLCPSHR